MAEKTNRKYFPKWAVSLVIAFALIAVVGVSFAIYFSTGSGNGTVNVAKWAVTLNGEDITAADASFDITFTEETANANVVSGKVAPGSVLYADFEIDPAGTEVSVEYSFTLGDITASTGNAPQGFEVSKVCTVADDNSETELTTSADGSYKGTISLTSRAALTTNDKVKVRVYITWAADVEENNADDTTVGKAAPTLTLTVTGTVKQVVA